MRHVCKHSFTEIHEVNLRTLTERHVITFRTQLINLLFSPLGTLTGWNKHDSSCYSKQNSKFYYRVNFELYYQQVYDKHIYFPASLTTICYIKENESERIKLKDDMEVEYGCSNIHIQSFGILQGTVRQPT